MPTPTTTMFAQPDATRRFLLPFLRRAYPKISRFGKITVFPLGSVQVGRGVFRVLVVTPGHIPRRRELFASYDAGGGSQMIYRFLRHLDQHGFGRGLLRAPRPIGYSSIQRVLIYESFPGHRLRDLVEQRSLSVAALSRSIVQSAAWLRRFHALPATVGNRRPQTLSFASFSRLNKQHRAALQAAIPLTNRALRASSGHLTLVHGDPHLANCIRGAAGTFAFIDYSESYVGNPLADVGMFLVHLDVALQPFFSRSVVAALQSTFIKNYFHGAPNRGAQRTVLAYQVRSAIQFLGFTADHHHQPRGYVGWILRRFERLIARGTQQLAQDDPHIQLAI